MVKSRKKTTSVNTGIFFITLVKENDVVVAHRVSIDPPSSDKDFELPPRELPSKTDLPHVVTDFKSVF